MVRRPEIDFLARPGDLWRLGRHRLLCGDSTDPAAVARVLGTERASLLVTSPPYGQQRAYIGGIGDWDTLMRGVFRHAADALVDDGQIIANLGLVHRDHEWQLYWSAWLDWMREEGWRRFGLYVWDQGPGLPGSWNGRLAPSFEFLFHFTDGARPLDGPTAPGVFRARVPCVKHHIAGKPVELMQGLMRPMEPGPILDPFMGSGTVGLACLAEGRPYVGIEVDATCFNVASKRLQEAFNGRLKR